MAIKKGTSCQGKAGKARRAARPAVALVLAAGLCLQGAGAGRTAKAETADELHEEVEELESEVNSLASQIKEAEGKLEELGSSLSAKEEEVGLLYSEAETLRIEAEAYREAMADRITYFYESGTQTVLEAFLKSGSLKDALSKLQYYKDICEYDAEQMEKYEDALEELDAKTEELEAEADSLEALMEEQAAEEARLASLKESAQEDLEAAEAAEEAQRAAEEAAAAKAASAKRYTVSDSGGQLTRSKGVVYYNGHRETWYSQRVLPGGGLNIPGRHVDDRGLVCDGDGYICVASSDYAKGTIVETSLGTGKVYDCGCASGTIDIYTDW